MARKFISYNGRIVGDSGSCGNDGTSQNMVLTSRTNDVP